MTWRTLAGITFVLLSALPAAAGEKKKPNVLPEVLPKILADVHEADKVELLSLDPNVEKAKDDDTGFHGWKVLGRTTLVDMDKGKTRTQTLQKLFKAIKDSNGETARCFFPRHGIVATKGDKSVELVICFQCLKIQYFVDGKPAPKFIPTTAAPSPVFNRVLREAKIKLPKRAK